MSGALPVVLLLVVVALVGMALRPTVVAAGRSPSQALSTARAHARRVTLVAWLVMIVAPAVVAGGGLPYSRLDVAGSALALAPLAGAVLFVAVGAIGEATWPRPGGDVRRAPLTRRGILDVTPRPVLVVTVAWALALVALLVLDGLVAGGRSTLAAGHGDEVRSRGPFPGWAYGRPMLAALALVIAGTFAVLWLVARRPAVADTTTQDDLALRRTSARRVLAGVQLALALTLAGTLAFSAWAVVGVVPAWADLFGPGTARTAGLVGVATAGLVAVAGTVVAAVASRETWPRAGALQSTPVPA